MIPQFTRTSLAVLLSAAIGLATAAILHIAIANAAATALQAEAMRAEMGAGQ